MNFQKAEDTNILIKFKSGPLKEREERDSLNLPAKARSVQGSQNFQVVFIFFGVST